MSDDLPPHTELTEAILRDGSVIGIRPATPDDEPTIRAFLGALSPESRRFRFGSAAPDLDAAARSWARPQDDDRVALIAVTGREHEVIGEAGYDRIDAERAEVGFVVADRLHGRGLGTHLLGRLSQVAERAGIAMFEAIVLPDNGPMLEVLRTSGFPIRLLSEPGQIRVELPTSLTDEAREHFARREEEAAVAAVRALLAPRSIAVIGASRDRGTIGGDLFHNLLEAQFQGPVYPVNRLAGSVQGVRAYASILDVPDPVDMAIVVVPAAAVADVARQCSSKGVKGLVVISAGFGETGTAGVERQAELRSICRESGMRLIGPNCMGVANTHPSISMNGQFAPIQPLPGRVGFLSQSGALGLALIDHANRLGLGLSSFVSVGNKADLSGNDFLCYWEMDDATDVILLYLESLGNPRRFARIARRVGRSKPIIAVKSGRSAAGARATSSHTGALIGASDVTVDALFRQAGVIRTDTLGELFDVASLLANQPAPKGRGVAILSNGGGPGILAADASEAAGLEVPALSDGVRQTLAEWLPSEASTQNPVDMIASATAADYGRAITQLASDPAIEAMIVIFAPPLVTRAEDVGREIRAATAALARPIPVVAVFMSTKGAPDELRGEGLTVPSFTYPEDAARALASAVHYGEWRARGQGAISVLPGIHREQGAATVAAALMAGPARWLAPDEVTALLSAYGLPLIESALAKTPEDAARVAESFGGPVALKGVAPDVVHKTEQHGVRLGLEGATAVEAAARDMAAAFEASGHRLQQFVVQRMAGSGIEMLVGVVNDRIFGPVVACAAGGTEAELLKDVAVRITPLTDRDAAEMVRSLATFPRLDGYRGAPKLDVAALEDVLRRVSAMVEAHPQIAEMDCNPVIVLPRGAVIVDARIRIDRRHGDRGGPEQRVL